MWRTVGMFVSSSASRVIDAKTVYWLAALLEGEGSFMLGDGSSPRISLGMSDQDIVERAAALLENPRIFTYQRPKRKRMWHFSVYGATAAAWMMTVYPVMG